MNELATDVAEVHDLALGWFTSSFREKGLFRYIYHPKTNQYPKKNNELRQLMASRLLAELSDEIPDLLPMHRKNLHFVFRHWYRERGEHGYVLYEGKSKLGANAMLLRTLARSEWFDQHAAQARRLVRGICSLMSHKGRFRAWYHLPNYAFDEEYLLTFYSGEALLALVEYHLRTGDQEALDAAVRSQNFYVDRYVCNLRRHYYPAYVPWHTMSLCKLWRLTGNSEYAEAIFVLNDELLKIFDDAVEVGRFYNPAYSHYGTPHSSSDGVYLEGLAYAYETALESGDESRRQTYRRAIGLAVGNLAKLQYTPETASRFRRPDRTIGAIRYCVDRTGTRVDCTQHTLDALRKLRALEIA